MKIGDKPLKVRAEHTVRVRTMDGEDVTLRVAGLPLEWDAIRVRAFPVPAAPRRWVKNGNGAILRDPHSKEALMEPDPDSPLKDKIADAQRRQQALQVYLALRESVSFESVNGLDFDEHPEQFDEKVADAVHAELEEAGFGQGHLLKIQNASLIASGLDDELLKQERESFS